MSMFVTTQSRWRAGEGKTAPGFGRQALPMLWDFAEVNPFAGAGGDFLGVVKSGVGFLSNQNVGEGKVISKDSARNSFQNGAIFNTDPPYYDNIAYADLSDYFYVWLRRGASDIYPNLFRRLVTPKKEELVARATSNR